MNESPHMQPDIQVRCSSGSFSNQNLVARARLLWAMVTAFRGAIEDRAQEMSLLPWGIHRGEMCCQEQTMTPSSMAYLMADSEKHTGTSCLIFMLAYTSDPCQWNMD